MGLDNELRVSITADTAGLAGGLSEAQSEVTATANSMAEAQQRAAVAARNLADAQKQLGASAEAGNAAAKAIIAEYQAANEAAQAILSAYVPANEAAAAAANTAAAGATRAAEAFQQQGVSAQVAALGGIKVLEGSMMGSSRAAAAFLSNTLGLSGVLAAAFPVVGALALGMVLVDIVEEIVKFGKEAEHLADIMDASWLDGAIAALSGMGDALKEDEKDMLEWERIHDRIISKSKTDAVRDAEASGGHAAGLRLEVEELQKKMQAAEKIAQITEKQLADEKQFASLTEATAAKNALMGHPITALEIAAPTGRGKAAADAKRDEEALKTIYAEIEDYRQDIHRKTLEAMEADEKAFEAAQKKENKPVKESPEVRDYFEARKRDLEDYTRRVQEDTRQQEEMLTRPFEAMTREADNAYKLTSEADKHQTEEFKANREQQIAQAEELSKRQIAAAQWEFEETKRDIESQEELGRISHKVADQRIEDALRLRDATIQTSQKNVLSLYDPIEGGKQLAEYQKAEDTMTADARKGAAEREAIVKQEQQEFIKGWKSVTNEFNTDFTQALNSWMTHSETAGRAFGQMLGTLERQTVDFVAQYLLKKAEMWAMDEAMQLLGLTKEKTAQTTAATQQIASNNTVIASNQALQTSTTAIVAAETALAGATTAAAAAFAAGIVGNTAQITSNVTLAESDQGLAAAEAALAAAPEGVLAAIAAGSEMYAAFVPWTTAAGFSIGGIVPGSYGAPMPAIVHAGERVLTASQNTTYENLANASTRSANVNLHYNPVIHGNANPDMLQEHARQLVSQVRRMVRPEALQ